MRYKQDWWLQVRRRKGGIAVIYIVATCPHGQGKICPLLGSDVPRTKRQGKFIYNDTFQCAELHKAPVWEKWLSPEFLDKLPAYFSFEEKQVYMAAFGKLLRAHTTEGLAHANIVTDEIAARVRKLIEKAA